MSFNLTPCGCCFNSPRSAPTGLWSSSSGFCSPSCGQPFYEDMLALSFDRWWNKIDKSWWFLKSLWSILANCLHSTWPTHAAFSYNAFHFYWQMLTLLRTWCKERAHAHSGQYPCPAFIAYWLQIKMQNELGRNNAHPITLPLTRLSQSQTFLGSI